MKESQYKLLNNYCEVWPTQDNILMSMSILYQISWTGSIVDTLRIVTWEHPYIEVELKLLQYMCVCMCVCIGVCVYVCVYDFPPSM